MVDLANTFEWFIVALDGVAEHIRVLVYLGHEECHPIDESVQLSILNSDILHAHDNIDILDELLLVFVD